MKRFKLELFKVWRELRDPYRPERHYMRGPGPRTLDKSRERQQSASASDAPRRESSFASGDRLQSA